MNQNYKNSSTYPGLQHGAPLHYFFHDANLKAFNGMEKDDEVKGEGNSYDFGARMNDSRLGRWLSIDKAFFGNPNQSTYSFCLNNPIKFVDPNGNWVVDENGNIVYTVLNPNQEYIQLKKKFMIKMAKL